MGVKEYEAINDNISEEKSIRKGPWSVEEDSILINYIAVHGGRRWNHLATNSGLRRTGKSCRLRWKNYLCPNVRHGNFTPQEQLLILQLHCSYGNRWSVISERLPGRTDNDIKNYWRTRVQKQARHLKYDINSTEFRDFILNSWIPTLSRKIKDNSDHNNSDNMKIINSDAMEQITGSLSSASAAEVGDQVSIMEDLLSDGGRCFKAFTPELDYGSGCFMAYAPELDCGSGCFGSYGLERIDSVPWFDAHNFCSENEN